MATITAHSDPEFDTFTYGDNCDVNPRAMGMRGVNRGDFLLFISRLQGGSQGSQLKDLGFSLSGIYM